MPVELGLRVCVVEDEHQFIIGHKVMEKQTDDQVALEMVEKAQDNFPNLQIVNFDKGYFTVRTIKGYSVNA